jgi:hypothetical protein
MEGLEDRHDIRTIETCGILLRLMVHWSNEKANQGDRSPELGIKEIYDNFSRLQNKTGCEVYAFDRTELNGVSSPDILRDLEILSDQKNILFRSPDQIKINPSGYLNSLKIRLPEKIADFL